MKDSISILGCTKEENVFSQPLCLKEVGTQSQWIIAGLNSEFSFSKTDCLTKAKEPSLFYCLPIARGRTDVG